jgi:hypothetical protein
MPVDDTLGSKHAKGSRKEAAPKRSGPQPAVPPKKRMKAAAQAESAERARQHKERDTKDKLIFGDKSKKCKDPDKRAGLQQTVINSRGRSRGFYENCVYLTLCCSLYKEAAAEIDSKYEPLRLTPSHPYCSPPALRWLFLSSGMDDPRVNETTVARRASELLHANHHNGKALFENFLSDGTVLVHDSSHRGKGSPDYVDSARLLGRAEMKTMDDFITDTHNDGGSLSVRQIADHLMEKHDQLLISHSAVRYALVHYLGYSWGEVKLRKCESDPDRVDVKRTYLVDYARALKLQDVDKTHVCVFLDESYIHQNHAAKKSWLKFEMDGGSHINRGTSKGKRLIILVSLPAWPVPHCPALIADWVRFALAACDHEGWSTRYSRT